VGMTAAAAAARGADAIGGGASAGVALLLIVGGGLVEGLAIGVLQSVGLGAWVPGLNRRAWIVTTTLVAGLGWAAASAPAALSSPGDDSTPPIYLVVLGALALGAVMGAVLGLAQAFVLRGVVKHPWRWIGINAVAWAPTMAVIFVGATTPDATWPSLGVILLGTATGFIAGAVLAVVSWPLLPALTGLSVWSGLAKSVLGSRFHRALDGTLVVLRITGRHTGNTVELPVMYSDSPDRIVIFPGRPQTKSWWRNLEQPAGVSVLLRGSWHGGIGEVSLPGSVEDEAARADYHRRWPRVAVPSGSPIVIVHLQQLAATV
ncbi:MAG: hypothetical protein ABJB03_10145, partial [Rhodoglobus sp.]